MRGTLRKFAEYGPGLLSAAFGLILLAVLLWTVWDATGLPRVYESWTTRECVRVEYLDGSAGDCSDLPDRYHHTWVE